MPATRNFFQTWAVALSAFAVGALAAPVLRPALRSAVKTAILAQRHLTRVVAGLREELEDIVAEAKEELGDEAGPDPHRHPPHDADAPSSGGAV